jgi:hypothetical protein
MIDFFVRFMETDQLGRICNTHKMLADQKEKGVTEINLRFPAEATRPPSLSAIRLAFFVHSSLVKGGRRA